MASFFKGSKSDQKSSRKRADYDLKVEQRVVTFAGDVPVRGTVRYIAEEKDSHGQLIVGLELVGTPIVTLSVNYKCVQVCETGNVNDFRDKGDDIHTTC